MFIVNGTLPGRGIHHAFSKSKITADAVEKIVGFLKENLCSFHLVKFQDEYRNEPDYFVYQTDGGTTRYKTLVQAICGKSLDHEGAKTISRFLLSQTNLGESEKYAESEIRYPSYLFRIDHTGNGRVKIHVTEPAFIIGEFKGASAS